MAAALEKKPRIGVALGGGAALGWAHIGALRALEDGGITPDVIAGTSIGALVGSCSMAGVLGPLEDIARNMSWTRMLGLADPQVGAPGLFKGGAVQSLMERYLGSRQIEDLNGSFVAVAADLISGSEVRISRGPIASAVRASISIPGVFLPVERDGALLVDGGLVNPVPVSAARALGADLVIAIDVTGDYHGRARAAGIGLVETGVEPPAQGPAWMRGLAGRLFKRTARRPGLYSVATTSIALMMRELAETKMRIDPPDVHVIPAVGHISLVDFDRADELISCGRAAMSAQLERLKVALGASSARTYIAQ